ncbi:MAG: ATP-binding cassette domain-containing protein [Candidatus Latescibacteria bacterium]|nr:ATP-binding cassette domain-containing protein [Candidatus Latescibacterota bacterium]
MIEVRELSKYYGDLAAVEQISFRAEKGEILGFLGPNGAGKTTTMRMLTCYLPPTSGSARVAGYDVVEESLEARRRIGYLPELPPLYADMTVRAYLRFVAKIKGVPNAQLNGRIDDTMEKTGVAHVHHSIIGHLSKGYRQRVGLAQALVHNPEVLILDEPTVGLDPKQIIEIRQVIKGLGGEHTIILSTHILPEVSMTCEKVVIIHNGRIVGEGTPQSLMAQLKEGEVLRAQISGPPEQVQTLLRSIDGVLEVAGEAGRSAAEQIYIITAVPGRDVRDLVARRVVDSGLGLRELRALEMTLEDIFLRLVTEEVKV